MMDMIQKGWMVLKILTLVLLAVKNDCIRKAWNKEIHPVEIFGTFHKQNLTESSFCDINLNLFETQLGIVAYIFSVL